jgi:hypothetical protein
VVYLSPARSGYRGTAKLTLFSPRFLRQRVQTYDELHQAGYTELVVYMGQQIQQFRRQARQHHLGALCPGPIRLPIRWL